MKLKARFDQELTLSMKARDSLRTSVLRMVKTAIRVKEAEQPGRPLDDDDIIRLLGSMIKQRKEAVEKYEAGNRPELAQKERDEIVIIEGYLPGPLSRDEIISVVVEAIEETGALSAKDFGKVMKAAMTRFKGQVVDGKQVGEIVRERLAQD